ncbi:hypothetical protein ACHAXS_004797 [Conticribra weissflogii]
MIITISPTKMERLIPGFEPLPLPLTSASIQKLLSEAITAAKQVPRHNHDSGHIGAIVTPEQYEVYSTTPWVDPIHPGMSPQYQQYGTFPSEVQKAKAKNTYNWQLAEWANWDNFSKRMRVCLDRAVPDAFKFTKDPMGGATFAGTKGFGSAYNATADDDASITSTLADMNIKLAETLEGFSEFSQSHHSAQSKNIQLEQEIASLRAPLAQANMHSANAATNPPLMTLSTMYTNPPLPVIPQQYNPPPPQYYPPPQYQQPPTQQYNPLPQYHQPPNQAQQQYQQYNNNNNNNRWGNRGSGVRRGHNNYDRNRGGCGGQQNQMYQGPYVHYYNNQGHNSGHYQQQQQQRQPNPQKYHNNMWYCHSCGFDVDHDSNHCNQRHQPWMTQEQAWQLMKDLQWLGCRKGAQLTNGLMDHQWERGSIDWTNNRSNNQKQQKEQDASSSTTMPLTDSESNEDRESMTEGETPIHNAHNATTTVCSKEWGIGDAGATGSFLLPGAPIINLRKAEKPLQIHLPDGGQIFSTHKSNLDIPWLPKEATRAYIAPGLAHTLLILIKQLCNNGCKVVYDKPAFRVYFN